MRFRSFAVVLVSISCLPHCVTAAAEVTPTDRLALSLIEKNGGFTFDFYGKSLAESGLYAVSPYPERSIRFERALTGDDIAGFRESNQDLLAKPHHDLGGWCEGKESSPPCYLDVSVTLANEEVAVNLGAACNQQSVAQLTREVRFLPTGGDGKKISGEPLAQCRKALKQAIGGN